jgi:hypothetical protein
LQCHERETPKRCIPTWHIDDDAMVGIAGPGHNHDTQTKMV